MTLKHFVQQYTDLCHDADKKEWKVAPDLIKTKSNKPKRLKEGKEGRGVGGREEQKNRENIGKTAK